MGEVHNKSRESRDQKDFNYDDWALVKSLQIRTLGTSWLFEWIRVGFALMYQLSVSRVFERLLFEWNFR